MPICDGIFSARGEEQYWNWAITALDPINSPVYDGSEFSMGGNGVYEEHNCTNGLFSTTEPPLGCIPAGEGGGCVETGPFKK
ncbi:hypothetical protein M7I_3140 [Glarea lozoyensis 74030]|uniref:Uncharacterized protein n=1 Tax=Glarea lozoyensis (strain ATCC 74030 / MF5533) TaxID=1104152 RepID=H0EKR1_GLAL7|nr:hypothetical protein M7I_3140 [Glarea lozoyensis 74030]